MNLPIDDHRSRVFNLTGLAPVLLTQFLSGLAMLFMALRSISCGAIRRALPSRDHGTEKCVKTARLNTLPPFHIVTIVIYLLAKEKNDYGLKRS
jgi:hypothetical protein